MAWRKNRRVRVTGYFAHSANDISRLRDVAKNRLFGERMIYPFRHNMGTIIERLAAEVQRRSVGRYKQIYKTVL